MKNKIIKKVLMCQPKYFATLDYSINPWMQQNKINTQEALKQWNELVKTYKDLGIKVETITPQKDSPDMVFATDQGLVKNKKVLLGRFRFKERKKESAHYKQWFEENNFEIYELPKDLFLEGNGEVYFWNELIFMGTGYRSSSNSAKFLEEFFNHKIITLQSINPAFFHLDVGFFPLDSTTIFFYPDAYSQETQYTLKKTIPNLIPFTKQEAYNLAGNSIVTGGHVIMQKNIPTFKNKLKNLGYTPIEVDLSEFKKSGGGIHCLTNILHSINSYQIKTSASIQRALPPPTFSIVGIETKTISPYFLKLLN